MAQLHLTPLSSARQLFQLVSPSLLLIGTDSFSWPNVIVTVAVVVALVVAVLLHLAVNSFANWFALHFGPRPTSASASAAL